MSNSIGDVLTGDMEKLSSKLKALHNTILTLYAELENENVEQQALDAVECIGFCVNDIKNSLDKELEEQYNKTWAEITHVS